LIWYMVFRQNIVVLFGLKKGDLKGGQSLKKEGKMEKKYLKKVLTGLSIASLVTGLGGLAIGAGG
jgi:radical SAM modification target selenobiotic family peptide